MVPGKFVGGFEELLLVCVIVQRNCNVGLVDGFLKMYKLLQGVLCY